MHRARDTPLGRDVAVKVLPAELGDEPSFRRRFEREAKTISQLQHPHVCALYDVGSEDGTDYLVMEFLEGESLEERLHAGPMAIVEVLRIGSEIAEAIGAAHEQGLVHRDLKPGNVMLTRTGVKVLDFGLARELDSARWWRWSNGQRMLVSKRSRPTERRKILVVQNWFEELERLVPYNPLILGDSCVSNQTPHSVPMTSPAVARCCGAEPA